MVKVELDVYVKNIQSTMTATYDVEFQNDKRTQIIRL